MGGRWRHREEGCTAVARWRHRRWQWREEGCTAVAATLHSVVEEPPDSDSAEEYRYTSFAIALAADPMRLTMYS